MIQIKCCNIHNVPAGGRNVHIYNMSKNTEQEQLGWKILLKLLFMIYVSYESFQLRMEVYLEQVNKQVWKNS